MNSPIVKVEWPGDDKHGAARGCLIGSYIAPSSNGANSVFIMLEDATLYAREEGALEVHEAITYVECVKGLRMHVTAVKGSKNNF